MYLIREQENGSFWIFPPNGNPKDIVIAWSEKQAMKIAAGAALVDTILWRFPEIDREDSKVGGADMVEVVFTTVAFERDKNGDLYCRPIEAQKS